MTTSTDTPDWFKSSYSNNGGACVEIAANLAVSRGVVPVRDSKDLARAALSFTPAAWTSFVSALRDGELPTTA